MAYLLIGSIVRSIVLVQIIVENNVPILIHVTGEARVCGLLNIVQFHQRIGQLSVEFERFVPRLLQLILDLVVFTVQLFEIVFQDGDLIFELLFLLNLVRSPR